MRDDDENIFGLLYAAAAESLRASGRRWEGAPQHISGGGRERVNIKFGGKSTKAQYCKNSL